MGQGRKHTLSAVRFALFSFSAPRLIGPDAVINGTESRQQIQTQMNRLMSRKQKESAVQQVKCSCPSRRTSVKS